MRAVRLSALFSLVPATAFFVCSAFAQQQQNVPDAPAPAAQNQTAPPNAPAPQTPVLPDLRDQVTPGKGAANPDDQGAAAAGQPAPTIENGTVGQQGPQQAPPPDAVQQTPPEIGTPSHQPYTITTGVTEVVVPVTVKDKHGREIAGLPWWRFRVYEDGVRQRITWFTTDAYPLSVAFVIDATLPADIMQKVNQSLTVVSNGLTPADTVSVITYAGTGPEMVTDFTAAQGPRLSVALQMAKKPGEQMGVPLTDGPFASGPTVNGLQADPTLAPQRGNASGVFVLPREIHPLNDAILYAAEQLASQPRGRRRVIYVISDGKNSRSKAGFKEVLQYLLSNNITVYGTNVGDSALWGIGYLDRTKLPFLQPEDVLPRYAILTGGDVDHELSENGIQSAFVKITDSLRSAYTLIYNSHQPSISGKYHSIDVRVEGLSGLEVDAKQGYYPSAAEE
ncbi:MAG TPA: VWA domain-containing protein [Acidobacteriaceae bacterium]|nr:VWA domain-containing protein [Acidobacteriaceae bacterium]